MMHWRARRLVPALPDRSLPKRLERALRRHVASCRRCQRRLGELELDEALLRRLPLAVVPLAASPASYNRLASLARWSDEPDLPDPERWRGAALGLAGSLATLVLVATLASWSPVMKSTGSRLSMASLPPDSSYFPTGFQQGRF